MSGSAAEYIPQSVKIPLTMLMMFQMDPRTCQVISKNNIADAPVATISIVSLLFQIHKFAGDLLDLLSHFTKKMSMTEIKNMHIHVTDPAKPCYRPSASEMDTDGISFRLAATPGCVIFPS